jgi:hypothetical protein
MEPLFPQVLPFSDVALLCLRHRREDLDRVEPADAQYVEAKLCRGGDQACGKPSARSSSWPLPLQ